MEQHYDYASSACGVLHNVFYPIPTKKFVSDLSESDLLSAWPRFDTDISHPVKMIQQSLKHDSFYEIERDFYHLFVGPGKVLAHPWGSVYTDRENLLFGNTTISIANFFTAHGVEFKLDSNRPLDHFGLILGVMAELFSQKNEQSLKILMAEHLLPWIHRVIANIELNAKTDFYRGFALLLKILLVDWQLRLNVTPIELRLYK